MLNQNKQSYYDYFIQLKPYLNCSAICKEVGVVSQQFSQFLVHRDFQKISVDDLEKIKIFIKEKLG